MSTTTVTPIEKKRAALLKGMTEKTREIATSFEERFSKANIGTILLQYDLGVRVAQTCEDEGTYGSGAVKQLAEFFGTTDTMLYNMRTFAEEFERDLVKEQSGRTMANGSMLTLGHWMQLMKLKDKDDQVKMLEKTFKNSLSTGDLEAEIRASMQTKNARSGGRKPATPSSAIIGLQKSFSLLNQWNRFDKEVGEKSILGAIDKMKDEDVTDALLEKLTLVKDTATDTKKRVTELVKEIDARVATVKKTLQDKAKAAEVEAETETEADAKAEPAKAKVKPTGGPAAKPKPKVAAK